MDKITLSIDLAYVAMLFLKTVGIIFMDVVCIFVAMCGMGALNDAKSYDHMKKMIGYCFFLAALVIQLTVSHWINI